MDFTGLITCIKLSIIIANAGKTAARLLRGGIGLAPAPPSSIARGAGRPVPRGGQAAVRAGAGTPGRAGAGTPARAGGLARLARAGAARLAAGGCTPGRAGAGTPAARGLARLPAQGLARLLRGGLARLARAGAGTPGRRGAGTPGARPRGAGTRPARRGAAARLIVGFAGGTVSPGLQSATSPAPSVAQPPRPARPVAPAPGPPRQQGDPLKSISVIGALAEGDTTRVWKASRDHGDMREPQQLACRAGASGWHNGLSLGCHGRARALAPASRRAPRLVRAGGGWQGPARQAARPSLQARAPGLSRAGGGWQGPRARQLAPASRRAPRPVPRACSRASSPQLQARPGLSREGLANGTCLRGQEALLQVGNRTAGARVASSPDSDLEAFSHNPTHGSFAPLAFQPSAMTNCANQRFLSKSRHRRIKKQRRYERLAATSQLSLCFKFRRSKGSIGHAFTVRIRTGNQNQTSFYPFVPHEISVLVELILGHLRYLLTDVPPQPNSPPDNVFRPDRPPKRPWVQKEGQRPASDSRNNRIPLVRTSSESTVRRPGKAPERAVPSPSPGRHATTRSRRGSSSSSPPTADGFGTGTPEPSPQSQSFSRGYGSILPTSLAYIVPSTRGCSPWRPDAVMSTTGRGRHSVLRIFKAAGRTGHHATCGALPAAGPYLRLSRFQITLPEAPADVSGLPNVAVSRHVPDRLTHVQVPFTWNLSPLRPSNDRRALLLIGAWRLPRRPGIGRALQRHPFSGLVDRQVSAQLGTVTRLPVHPASPVLLTKNGPLGALDSVARLNEAAAPIGRGRCAPDASNHWLYLIELAPSSSYPEGNFGGNQLLDGSISLSPLYPSQTNDLHVSIAAGLHQSFLWLRPLRHSSPSFGSRQACSHSNPSQKIKVGRRCNPRGIPPVSFLAPYGFTRPLTRTHVRLLGPCFKTGRMGATGRCPERACAGARRDGARCSPRSQRRISTAFQRPGLRPPPRSASVHAPSRSADRLSPFHIRPGRIAGPHPLPSRQFQALFDSLFKVLFIFPSRYLFAIGLSPIFSLGRNLRPIGAAFPNNPTRRQRLVVRQGPVTTGLSPSPAPPSRGLGPGPPLRTLLQTTIRTPRAPDSQAGHFPVRSPLLGESL
uniref:Senescence-associated protein n=1 Tax=Salix viminalis TaxID=40686 RepID=A0A6N2N888_SALVM